MLHTELIQTKKLFNLDELLQFQLTHDVQIIRAEDLQYNCYIDGKVYASELTPLFALCVGVELFNTTYKTC